MDSAAIRKPLTYARVVAAAQFSAASEADSGALAPTERFHSAVQDAKIGPDKDIPHITPPIIVKYITDLQLLGLL